MTVATSQPKSRPLTRLRARLGIDARLFRGSALSVASQAVGVIQLIALIWRSHGATVATDAYLYLFSLGLLPTQVLTVGVLYPMLMNRARISAGGERRIAVTVPFLSAVAVTAGAGFLESRGRLGADLVPAVVLLASNAIIQASIWRRCIAATAGGTPEWEASLALPANLAATLALLLPWTDSTATVTAMVAALLLGNVAFLGALIRQGTGRSLLDSLPAVGDPHRSAAWWFAAKSMSSYGGLTILQSLAVLLPASAVTLLSVAVKIASSTSAVLINAVMPRLVHQGVDSASAGRSFLRWITLLLASVGSLAVAATAGLHPQALLGVWVLALWLLASAAAATAQRMAYRFLAPNASRVTILAVLTVVALALATSRSSNVDLVSVLCAYALLDALVATTLLWKLADRVAAAFGGVITIGILGSLAVTLTS